MLVLPGSQNGATIFHPNESGQVVEEAVVLSAMQAVYGSTKQMLS